MSRLSSAGSHAHAGKSSPAGRDSGRDSKAIATRKWRADAGRAAGFPPPGCDHRPFLRAGGGPIPHCDRVYPPDPFRVRLVDRAASSPPGAHCRGIDRGSAGDESVPAHAWQRSEPDQSRRLHLRRVYSFQYGHWKVCDLRAGHRQRTVAGPRRPFAANGRGNRLRPGPAHASFTGQGAVDRSRGGGGGAGGGVQCSHLRRSVRD